MKVDDLGWYSPQPMHEANLATGAPLLTIDTTDPTDARIAIIGQLERLPDEDEIVVISHTSHWTRVIDYSLNVFSADPLHGITHDALERLRANTKKLRQAETIAAKREADQQEHFDRLKARRRAQHVSIAAVLDSEHADWSTSKTHAEMRAYFGRYLRGRIDTTGDVLCQWQCLIYFTLIAGHQGEEFTVRDAHQKLVRHKIPIDQKTAFKQIAAWLRRLYDLDLLDRARGKDGYPTYWAITCGALW